MNMKNKFIPFLLLLMLIIGGCTKKTTCPLCNGTNVVYGNGQSLKCPICKDGKVTEKTLKEVTKRDLPCGFCGGTGFTWGGMCSHCMGSGKTSFLDSNRDLFGQKPSSSHSPNPFGGRDFSKCPICHGTGKCDACAGNGWVLINGSLIGCSICHGSGRCQSCYGSGEFTR